MKYYKLQWIEKCPKCGKIHKLQKWSETQGGASVAVLGYCESNKTLKYINKILDKQRYVCECGYIKGNIYNTDI